MDAYDEMALVESAERWVAEVNAAYADGGYAAGDGPTPPLDEMEWLLAHRVKALRLIDAWHQMSGHLRRIVEASPNMRVSDAFETLRTDYDRIERVRRDDPT